MGSLGLESREAASAVPAGRRRAVLAAVALVAVLAAAAGAVLRFAGDEANVDPAPGVSSPSDPGEGQPARPAGAAGTRYGASFQLDRGESYGSGLARTDAALGGLDLVRVFYPGMPDAWPGKAPGRDVVVSFKLDPRAVVAGDHDAPMRAWFAAAPRDRDVFWVFWHEPEDDIEEGSFTPEEFRAAFAHLSGLADGPGNPRLHATLVLMSYSTRENSGRDWRDYVPPADSLDVFAWDVYNRQGKKGVYAPPAELLDAPRKAAESVGKPFAVAEMGSVLAPDDDGSGRAEWLGAMGDYLGEHGAVFAAYFDFSWNQGEDDYRLRDAPSLEAWREIAG